MVRGLRVRTGAYENLSSESWQIWCSFPNRLIRPNPSLLHVLTKLEGRQAGRKTLGGSGLDKAKGAKTEGGEKVEKKGMKMD